MNDRLLTEQQNTYIFLFSSDNFAPFLMFSSDSMVRSVDFMLEIVCIQIFMSLFCCVSIKIFNLKLSSLLIYFLVVNLRSSVPETLNEQMHVDTQCLR